MKIKSWGLSLSKSRKLAKYSLMTQFLSPLVVSLLALASAWDSLFVVVPPLFVVATSGWFLAQLGVLYHFSVYGKKGVKVRPKYYINLVGSSLFYLATLYFSQHLVLNISNQWRASFALLMFAFCMFLYNYSFTLIFSEENEEQEGPYKEVSPSNIQAKDIQHGFRSKQTKEAIRI